MRCGLASQSGFLLRKCGMRLRCRRLCLGPLLLLLGVALGLFYQTLNIAPNRFLIRLFHGPTHQEGLEEGRVIATLERLLIQGQPMSGGPARRATALVLTGQHVVTDTEVQLYRRVLQQMHYEVRLSRYAESSSLLQPEQGLSRLSLLLCLSSSETSCMRRVPFTQLQSYQKVNLLPPLLKAFSDVGDGRCHMFTHPAVADSKLPMKAASCGSTHQKQQAVTRADGLDQTTISSGAPDAVVNIFVLVTSVNPLISFLHNTLVLTGQQDNTGQRQRLKGLRPEALGYAGSSQSMLEHIKRVIRDVLQTVASTHTDQTRKRCLLCYQLLTFTLLFNAPLTFSIIQVDTDWTFSALKNDESFAQEITRDLMLEDMLGFLLKSPAPVSSCRKDDACAQVLGVSLSEDDLTLVRHIYYLIKNLGPFLPVFTSPALCTSSLHPHSVSDLLIRAACYHGQQQNHSLRALETESLDDVGQTQDFAVCAEPLVRQIYTDPPLPLTPLFDPRVKEYHVEVPFDIIMVRIHPEPVSANCRVHLDEHRGPSVANIPIGLGRSRVSILVTDAGGSETVRTIYTLHVSREERPGLPMFGDHVMCSFTQDCGLLVQPDQSCGLEPFNKSLNSMTPCSSGDTSGGWVVPCLSCVDNRTCDWREIVWQPQDCYYPIIHPVQLQNCLADSKLLFIGDSTNRGMMYFLTERLNTSLLEWEKVHDTVIYRNINGGRSLVSFTYFPQFWMESNQAPTFTKSLDALLDRCQPLLNSRKTVLVVGGVQWLKSSHLKVIRDTLNRKGLNNILVVVKSLGMGFHLFVDGVRSLKLKDIQNLFRENRNLITAAKKYGFEVIDTFSITMGRYKEFLQGRCACHFHQVEKKLSPTKSIRSSSGGAGRDVSVNRDDVQFTVKGAVNQVYSEILLSQLCPDRTDPV